ncbi:MAG: helix-turn-helix transcriptional regulator [Bacteroidaceae bacterium]|nr:helix-turn-helix transcriptional regulator [Bacteroidaceae bacterium]
MIEGLVTSMPMFVAAFWSVVLVLYYVERRNAITLRLFIFMLTTGVLYGCHYVYFNFDGRISVGLETLYRCCNLAVYPLYYFYLRSLTLHRVEGRVVFLSLVPALVLPLLGIRWPGVEVVAKGVFALEVVVVGLLGCRLLHGYERMIAENYADAENRSLVDIRRLLLFFVATSLASLVANFLGREQFTSSVALLALPSVLFSALIFMLGFVGVREMRSVLEVQRDLTEDVAVASAVPCASASLPAEGVKDDDCEKFEILKQQIQRVMDEEKLFLQPNLKINDLARRLGSNRNYIYRAVNVGMGISFSEFVNHRRIDYALQLMASGIDAGFSDLYMRCGFSSQSAFYRNFKAYKGCSPTDYVAGAEQQEG